MIVGSVSADLEATVSVVVRDAAGREHEVDAIIDTGFSSFLTLPATLIASLGLRWRGRGETILGDGSVHRFDVYDGVIIWDG